MLNRMNRHKPERFITSCGPSVYSNGLSVEQITRPPLAKQSIKKTVDLFFNKKIGPKVAQYPYIGIAPRTLYFTPWPTYSIEHHLGFSGKHSATLQLMLFIYKHPPLSIARFTQLSEPEQCRAKHLSTVLHGSTRFVPGYFDRTSEALATSSYNNIINITSFFGKFSTKI